MRADLDWWLSSLSNYGSLFLGEETTVAFGDKASGPNHILPTKFAARYSAGLSVHKFLRPLTWQRWIARRARPSPRRQPGSRGWKEWKRMRARPTLRLRKYFPGHHFDMGAPGGGIDVSSWW